MNNPDASGNGRGFLRSETGIRLISAIVLIALAMGTTWIGGVVFAVFWLVAGSAVLFEWIAMVWIARRIPSVVAGALAYTAFVLAHLTDWPGIVLAAIALTGGALVVMISMGRRDRIWAGIGYAVGFVVVAVPIIVRSDPALGALAIVWIFAVVWGTDIAAYFTGRALGGPRLWPRLSPNKTWAGFFGGLASAMLAGLLLGLVARLLGQTAPVDLWALTLLSGLASLIGQGGDLAESALKRHFEVKDSGSLIPGHGGVMDRLDAFFAVCVLVGLMLLGLSPFGIGAG